MWILVALMLAASSGEPYIAACGRSPIPQGNETFNTPIPYKRLQPEVLPDLPPPGVAVPWRDADRFLGQKITVEGKIVNTRRLPNLTFLNFDKDWQGKFAVVVYASAHDPSFHPETEYLNKTIRVTGVVESYKNRPEIQVEKISQIEIVK